MEKEETPVRLIKPPTNWPDVAQTLIIVAGFVVVLLGLLHALPWQ